MKKNYTVITGASSGIGYEVAWAFAKRGKNLILVARRKERLLALKELLVTEYPELEILVKCCDLSDKTQVYQLYESLTAYSIETWINNAGTGSSDPMIMADLDKIEQMIHLNVEATTLLSTLYVKDYAQVEGTQLINVSSAMGYVVAAGNVPYSASKFFTSALTEGLAAELREAPIQVKVLAPALTATDFIGTANVRLKESLHSPKEVANFLLQLYDSDKSIVVGVVNEKKKFKLRKQILPSFPR
ncbi:hypothetical protein IGI37_002954 [Enterococcus sp. AZ194]